MSNGVTVTGRKPTRYFKTDVPNTMIHGGGRSRDVSPHRMRIQWDVGRHVSPPRPRNDQPRPSGRRSISAGPTRDSRIGRRTITPIRSQYRPSRVEGCSKRRRNESQLVMAGGVMMSSNRQTRKEENACAVRERQLDRAWKEKEGKSPTAAMRRKVRSRSKPYVETVDLRVVSPELGFLQSEIPPQMIPSISVPMTSPLEIPPPMVAYDYGGLHVVEEPIHTTEIDLFHLRSQQLLGLYPTPSIATCVSPPPPSLPKEHYRSILQGDMDPMLPTPSSNAGQFLLSPHAPLPQKLRRQNRFEAPSPEDAGAIAGRKLYSPAAPLQTRNCSPERGVTQDDAITKLLKSYKTTHLSGRM